MAVASTEDRNHRPKRTGAGCILDSVKQRGPHSHECSCAHASVRRMELDESAEAVQGRRSGAEAGPEPGAGAVV